MRRITLSSIVAIGLALPAPGASAQEAVPDETPAVDAKAFAADEPGTTISADLSYVFTSGNSRTSSLGFGGAFDRRWERHGMRLSADGTRADSSADLDFAQGTPGRFVVVRPDPEPTVEYYKLRGRYDYRFGERMFFLTGAGWERNRFSGLRSRFVAETGVGYVFAAGEPTDFRMTLGATYTNNQEVVANPDLENNFAGARLGWTLRRKVSANSELVHDLLLDENLKQTDDFRADASLALVVSMTARLALKASYRLLYRNLPALQELLLVDGQGVEIGAVAVPLDKVDQGVSVSLVFNFERRDEPPG